MEATTALEVDVNPIISKLDEAALVYLRDTKRKKDVMRKEIETLEQQILEVELRIEEEKKKLGIVEKPLNRDEIVDNARKRMKVNAHKAIEYLIASGYFPERGTPQEVATFFFETENLSKSAIGDYLGEHHDANVATLNAFASLQNFTGIDFDIALRQYLWRFRLPGESQKIDRMMQAFSNRFHECNPQLFPHADVCYVFAFSCIMLNTSLHNPNVQFKPTLQQFISMNSESEHGNLPTQIFEKTYNSIAKTPFKLAEDLNGIGLTFFNPEREGWLTKDSGGTWKRRWVVLTNSCLYYFKNKEDAKPRGIIPLENVIVRITRSESAGIFNLRRTIKPQRIFAFELVPDAESLTAGKEIKGCKTNQRGEVVQDSQSRYVFSHEKEAEIQEWVSCISSSIKDGTGIYDLFKRKRAAVK